MASIVGQRANKIIVVSLLTGWAVLLPTSASAGLPGAVFGLLTAPLRMVTHGIGASEPRRHGSRPHERAREATSHEGARESATREHEPAPPQAAATAGGSAATGSAAGGSAAGGSAAGGSAAGGSAANPPAPPPRVEAHADTTPGIEAATRAPGAAPPAPWPTESPSVYEDLMGYILWPGDYAERLWAHGYGDIMNTFIAPTAAGADSQQAARAMQNGMCSAKASELAEGLITRTAAAIAPNPEQKAALDALGGALATAIERGRATVCSDTGTPLKRTIDGLWTMWDATLLIRPPLEKFYDSLDAEQKAKLAGSPAASQALARACADQQPADTSDRMAQALSTDQRQRLEALRRQSSALVKFLAASCPKEVEPTPIDRLKAASDRMNALLYVVVSMQPSAAELNAPQGATSPVLSR